LVFGAGVLATLTSTTTPAAGAAGNVTPSIYVANYGGNDTLTFPLTASGNVAPTVTNSSTSFVQPPGEAFDGSGDLWVANFHGGAGSVVEFTPAQLAASGSPTPAVTISGLALASANSVAFDGSGNMWVQNFGGVLVEYTPGQLTASGSPTPAVSLTNPSGGGWGLSFDSAGDLWSASYGGGNTVFEYTPGQLATSGSPTPAVTLSGSGLNGPTFPTFDTHGDLWIANAFASPGSLVEFTPAQIATSGSPTPNVTITGSELNGADGLAFDGSGNLWAAGFGTSTLAEFSPGQLATSGSPTPANTISGGSTGLNAPGGIAIAEAPTVTAVSPASGPGLGGTTVTITGNGFLPGSSVAFGSTPAKSVTYVGATTLTAVAPPGIGRVDVTVSTTFGTSGATPADQFSYQGYLEVASDGGIFAFNAPFSGSMGGKPLNKPIVGMAADPLTGGYWEVASDGGIFAFNAPFYGSMGGKPLNAPIVGIAADPMTGGYWEVASDGGIFNFNAPFWGSMGGKPLNKPIVGIAGDPATGGYWEVASDGGIFNFNAPFSGSMGGKPLNKPMVGIASTPDGGGYWEVANDGGIFNYGDAGFAGSMGGKPLNAPIVGIGADPNSGGYLEVASDGGIFAFNSPFFGSMGGKPLNKPIVGIAG
jgi:sugar lactone lactonase YvrE